jgi:dihydrofolate reductase
MKTVIVAALTADGFIGRSSDHLADWTGKADKKLFVRVTKEMGVMVMGSRTFATIGRALPGRRTIVYTSRPEEITTDGVETTSEPPAELVARLEKEGAHGLAVAGGASIYNQFMQTGVVDELYLTITPVLFGEGVRLFTDEMAVSLKLASTEQLDEDTVLLHYVAVK